MHPFVNIPNAITLLRLLLIFPFGFLLSIGNELAAVILFLFISVMDGVDGAIARIRKQETRFGEIFDGLSDVIILLAAFILLALYGFLPKPWHPFIAGTSLFLLVSKIAHLRSTNITQHTLAGKANALAAYLSIISAILFPSSLEFSLSAFLVLSVVTGTLFLLDSVSPSPKKN